MGMLVIAPRGMALSTNFFRRSIEPKLTDCARKFPIVELTGARQVGKITLLRHVFPGHRLVKFNPVQDLHNARRDPEAFLDEHPPPLILKGTQYVPELLPALLRRAATLEKPGAYIVSSVFDLPELAQHEMEHPGLIGMTHLESMTLEELEGLGHKHHWLSAYLAAPRSLARFIPTLQSERPSLIQHLWRGGLPRLVELPENLVADYFCEYLQTYAERDARRLTRIDDLARFGAFLSRLSAFSGKVFDVNEHTDAFSADQSSAWLDALCSSYQWQELPNLAPGTPSHQRLGYLNDSGLACAVRSVSSPMALTMHPQLHDLFRAYAVSYVMRHVAFLDEPVTCAYWRTERAELPLVLCRGERLYPIEVRCAHQLDNSDLTALKAFRAAFGKRVQPGILIYAGARCYALDANTTALPWDAGLHLARSLKTGGLQESLSH